MLNLLVDYMKMGIFVQQMITGCLGGDSRDEILQRFNQHLSVIMPMPI